MTDNEIIKALKCCSDENINACDNCPFHKQCENDEQLVKYALDLINRQKAEIERLQEYYKLYHERQKEIEELSLEIEYLSGKLKFVHGTAERQFDEIKRKDKQIEELVSFQRFCKKQAIKEFAEKLRDKAYEGYSSRALPECVFISVEDIDNLVKEMENKNNA